MFNTNIYKFLLALTTVAAVTPVLGATEEETTTYMSFDRDLKICYQRPSTIAKKFKKASKKTKCNFCRIIIAKDHLNTTAKNLGIQDNTDKKLKVSDWLKLINKALDDDDIKVIANGIERDNGANDQKMLQANDEIKFSNFAPPPNDNGPQYRIKAKAYLFTNTHIGFLGAAVVGILGVGAYFYNNRDENDTQSTQQPTPTPQDKQDKEEEDDDEEDA